MEIQDAVDLPLKPRCPLLVRDAHANDVGLGCGAIYVIHCRMIWRCNFRRDTLNHVLINTE